MEKILLTGATGFVGRQILKQLENKGHQVTIVVKPDWENRISINEALTKIIEVDDIFSQTSKWWEKKLTGISTIPNQIIFFLEIRMEKIKRTACSRGPCSV